jgi:FkbM family methyltransferase
MGRTIPAVLKGIPGVRWLHSSFVRTPGSWIFSRRNLGWLTARDAYLALPPLFRIFARYCRIAPNTPRGRLFGAELLHFAVSSITRLLGLPDRVRVRVGTHVVYLHITDPRALVVPHEIVHSTETRFLAEVLGEGDTFVDVGANHGSFSVVAGGLVGASGRVVAIEPQPRLAELVQRSLAENCQCPFTVLQIACADAEGEQEFFIPARSSGSASLFRAYTATSTVRRVPVRVKRFDDALDWRRLPGKVVMKIDIEGAELDFLKGGAQALAHLRPEIVLEVNPFAARGAGTSLQELATQLQALGYHTFRELDNPTPKDLARLEASRSRNVVLLPLRPPAC